MFRESFFVSVWFLSKPKPKVSDATANENFLLQSEMCECCRWIAECCRLIAECCRLIVVG